MRSRVDGSSLTGRHKQHILPPRAVDAAFKQTDLTRILVAHRPETTPIAQRVAVPRGARIVRDMEQAPVQAAIHNDSQAQS